MRNFGRFWARIYALRHGKSESNQIIVDLLDLKPDDRILEIGCGPGAAAELAASQIGAERVAAVDPSQTFVDMVRKRVPGADVRLGSATEIPFDDGTFTAIWSIASMHHWPSRESGLAAQAAKLAGGGRLLVAERLLDKPGHGITATQTAEVMEYLKGIGLVDIESQTVPNGAKTMQVIRAVAPS